MCALHLDQDLHIVFIFCAQEIKLALIPQYEEFGDRLRNTTNSLTIRPLNNYL